MKFKNTNNMKNVIYMLYIYFKLIYSFYRKKTDIYFICLKKYSRTMIYIVQKMHNTKYVGKQYFVQHGSYVPKLPIRNAILRFVSVC